MNILNLTQHDATPDQLAAGVVEPAEGDKVRIRQLLTFEQLPEGDELKTRAYALGIIAACTGADAVLIGGAPYFMVPLEAAMKYRGLKAFYAFSLRESAEAPDGEGGVRKTQVFKHAGFIEV